MVSFGRVCRGECFEPLPAQVAQPCAERLMPLVVRCVFVEVAAIELERLLEPFRAPDPESGMHFTLEDLHVEVQSSRAVYYVSVAVHENRFGSAEGLAKPMQRHMKVVP